MQLTITLLAAALSLASLALLWRLAATVAMLRAEIADSATVTWGLLDELLGEWDGDYTGGKDEPDEPNGVQVAGPADCDNYAYTPVPLYDGQGWYTPRSHYVLRMTQGDGDK